MANEFTVLLDKREGYSMNDAELGGASLLGQALYKEGGTGVADSIEACLQDGGIQAPTFGLIRGRGFAPSNSPAWNEWHHSNAERLTIVDANGIFGEKGAMYALDIQNGGLFVWNPGRIREAVTSGKLKDGAIELSQNEVDGALDAMSRNDYAGLSQIVHGNVVYAGGYPGFLEASNASDFTQGMSAAYLVIRPADEARKLPSGRRPLAEQRTNPDLVIASAGIEPLGKMLDQAGSFGWEQFGSWHDGYKKANRGRVVVLNVNYSGVIGLDNLYYDGRSVRVAPEALDAFYKHKDADPLALIVNQARQTGKPVEFDDGIMLYIPQVKPSVKA